jgi:PAS domain S-box-containing protein
LGNSESIFDVEEDSGPRRSWFASMRRSAEAGWSTLLLGAIVAAAVLFALLLRLPGTDALSDAGALGTSTAQFGWAAAAEGDETSVRLQQARVELTRRVAGLQASLAQSELEIPELAGFQARLAALPPRPTAAALEALLLDAQLIASAVREQVAAQQQRFELGLKGLTAMLALLLALPMHGLWRQRRRLGATLRLASDRLDSGDWQDAVQRLREDRLGAPSAFDALAAGVEGALGESERRWQALADLSADWYWESDPEGRLSWLSGATPVTAVLGWTPSDVLGRRRDEMPFLDEPAQGWAALHARLAARKPFRDFAYRARARHGDHAAWISISGRPRFDARGEFTGYEGVGRDITESRAAQERLVASEQRWSLMAGLASDWYWETDAEHRLRPLGPERARRLPEFAERMVGRTRWEAHRDALTPEQWAEHQADLEAHRPFRSLQFEMDVGDGKFLWVSISGIPRFDGQGRFLGYHGVGRDITVRKEAERLLLRHNEALQRAVGERTSELEQLNLDLDAFSRQLAHELRTPISHVQGLAHLLEARAGQRLNDEERQLIALQVQAARHMRDTVDALMLLARSTVQAMPMEVIDVSALAVQVLGELPLIDRRAAVEWHVEPGLLARGSIAALRIVLANLLGNAAKFTRHVAHPVVHVRGSTDADGRLRVSVEDNGAGFDPAQGSRLFQAFTRLHTGDEFHGTGIGLTIVLRIVERHGGTVAARGEPGRGAVFEFTLAPAGVATVARADTEGAQPLDFSP